MGDFTDRMKWLMALIYWVISLIILRLSCGLFVRADDIKKLNAIRYIIALHQRIITSNGVIFRMKQNFSLSGYRDEKSFKLDLANESYRNLQLRGDLRIFITRILESKKHDQKHY